MGFLSVFQGVLKAVEQAADETWRIVARSGQARVSGVHVRGTLGLVQSLKFKVQSLGTATSQGASGESGAKAPHSKDGRFSKRPIRLAETEFGAPGIEDEGRRRARGR